MKVHWTSGLGLRLGGVVEGGGEVRAADAAGLAGPHAQLMRNHGLYAELYQLQASAYE